MEDSMDLGFLRVQPFTDDILRAPVPEGFRQPKVDNYDGMSDPADHLQRYVSTMQIAGADDAIMCRAFSSTLTGAARKWFAALKHHRFSSLEDLSAAFIRQFLGSRPTVVTAAQLLDCKQGEGESLRNYLRRFNAEALQVASLSDEVKALALTKGLWPGSKLAWDLSAFPAEGIQAIYDRAYRYMQAEELNPGGPGGRAQRERRQEPYPEASRRKRKEREDSPIYTPLVDKRGSILHALERKGLVRWPRPLTSRGARNKSKYCQYHRDHGHDTEDCRELKQFLEELVKTGKLREYVRASPCRAPREARRREDDQDRGRDGAGQQDDRGRPRAG